MSEFPLYNLSQRVEETVFTPADEAQMYNAFCKCRAEEKAKSLNAVIVGTVESLRAHVIMGNFKQKLIDLAASETNPRNLRVPVFEFTRTYLKRDASEWLPEYGATVKDIAKVAEEDMRVWELPVPVRVPLTSEQRNTPLREVFHYQMYTLELLSHYMGGNIVFCQEVDPTPVSNYYDIYEVRKARIMMCYHPWGLPLYRKLPLDAAKKRWALKTTWEELYQPALRGTELWGGEDTISVADN
jgi:hypothetical protein